MKKRSVESIDQIATNNLESSQLAEQSAEEPVLNTQFENLYSRGKKAIEYAGDITEKAIDFIKYKGLKMKEYFGIIKTEELDSLLDIDFKQELSDNPPIDGVFSPSDELEKIRGMSREEKKKELKSFKSKLERQRQAKAMCRVFIERKIEADNDVVKEELMAEVERFREEYGFDEDQLVLAEQLIDSYYEARVQVKKLREKYPDNTELVSKITGVKLDGVHDFDVRVGPMNIEVRAGHFDTLKLLDSNRKLFFGNIIGGFASNSVIDESIYFTVINDSLLINLAGSLKKRIAKHELEHLKNRIFRKIFESSEINDTLDKLFADYLREQDSEIATIRLIRYFGAVRDFALADIKDEIFARVVESQSNIKNVLIDKYQLFVHKDSYYNNISEYLGFEQDELSEQEKIEFDFMMMKFSRIITSALRAADRLLSVNQSDQRDYRLGRIKQPLRVFTNQEVVALLADVPLAKWDKTVNRFLAYQKLNAQ